MSSFIYYMHIYYTIVVLEYMILKETGTSCLQLGEHWAAM